MAGKADSCVRNPVVKRFLSWLLVCEERTQKADMSNKQFYFPDGSRRGAGMAEDQAEGEGGASP